MTEGEEGQCQERRRKGRGKHPRVGKNGQRSRHMETTLREENVD